MRRFSLIIMLGLFASSSPSVAGGIVGSGAGIVEMNFQYAYSNLSTWIKSCQSEVKNEKLTETTCASSGRSGEMFNRIVEVIRLNRSRQDRIVFISGALEPDFFKTGEAEPHRIAKTLLTSESSIFVNVDQLYDSNTGRPALDIPAIAAVLVHELGHQAGEPSHDYLNGLAGQLRLYLGRSSSVYNFEVGSRFDTVQMTLVNQRNPMISTIIFNWQGNYSVDLTARVSKLAHCRQADQNLSGFELYNGQFVPTPHLDNAVDFNFWMNLYCFDVKTQRRTKEKLIIQVTLTSEKKIDLRLMP